MRVAYPICFLTDIIFSLKCCPGLSTCMLFLRQLLIMSEGLPLLKAFKVGQPVK